MNFQNYTQTYSRPVPRFSIAQYFRSLDFAALHRETAGLIKGTGKVACLAAAILFLGNYAIMMTIGSVELSIESLRIERHDLLDKNIEYRAARAELMDPAQLSELAQKKLSLQPAAGNQVAVYDRNKNTFQEGQFDLKSKTFVKL